MLDSSLSLFPPTDREVYRRVGQQFELVPSHRQGGLQDLGQGLSLFPPTDREVYRTLDSG